MALATHSLKVNVIVDIYILDIFLRYEAHMLPSRARKYLWSWVNLCGYMLSIA